MRSQDERAQHGARLFAAEANRERQLHIENVMATVGKRYMNCTLDSFDAFEPAQKKIVDLLRRFCEGIKAQTDLGHGLLLYGPAGTGKDHLMVSALRFAAAAQISARWVSGVDLYATWRDEIGDEVNEHRAMRTWTKPTILAISDPQPPKDPLTAGQAAKLYDLIDQRYRAGKPTWATVNASNFDDLAKKLTVPIADRLRDGALALGCNWPSYRRSL